MKKCLLTFVLLLPFFTAKAQSVTLTTLISFNSTNGSNPQAGLLQASDGNFYGTTTLGGSNNLGTIFKMTPAGALTTLVSFNSTNGAQPYAGLIQAKDGNFYGTTSMGGTSNFGTVFMMTQQGALTTLVSFTNGNGSNPQACLIQGSDTNFYGTTSNGSDTQQGTIFQMTPAGVLTTIFFRGGPAPLLQDSDGNFLGTTIAGGSGAYGTVFKINPPPLSRVTNLASFNLTNGANPYAGLLRANDGNYYGTTANGVTNNLGTIFRVTPTGDLTTLYTFKRVVHLTNGYFPRGGLVQGSDGNFYGITPMGGNLSVNFGSGAGTIFKITPAGDFTTLILFGNTNGNYPVDKLIQGSDGNFYGTTYNGGTNGDFGTIFRFTVPLAPVLQPVVKFSNSAALSWSSVSNFNYQLQFQTNLTQTNWVNLGGAIRATNGTMSATDSNATDGERFYRVVLSP